MRQLLKSPCEMEQNLIQYEYYNAQYVNCAKCVPIILVPTHLALKIKCIAIY